jgi:4-amino-4-deoxy-L-arabinose transferase-like glycosyltransferase
MLKIYLKHKFLIITVFILLIAACLRLYKVGDVPHGITWDEAAIGYNGYAVITTRRDEWITRLPVSFRSFGDYKAPFAIYLSGIFTYIFGLDLWVLRLPFVLFGIAAVLGIILLTKELGKKLKFTKNQNFWLPLVAGILLTLSPWHLHFSRTGFESGIALSLTIWATYFLVKSFNGKSLNLQSLLLSTILFVISLYTYHSSKIVAPLLILSIFLWNKEKVKGRFIAIVTSVVTALFLSYPLIKDSLFGKGLERAGTLIFMQTDSFLEALGIFFKQFFAHLNPTFLVLGQSTSFRHGDGQWGVLLPVTFFLVMCGVIFIFNRLKQRKSISGYLFSLIWICFGILPAALGFELVPHSNRALLALPGFIILAILGLRDLSDWLTETKINKEIPGSHGEKNMVWVSVIGMLIFLQAIFFVKYLNNYYTDFAAKSSDDFVDGYLEAFNYVKDLEKDTEKIVFTSEYGQPYIFALFARKTNPIWYQGGSLVKYEFKDVNIGDLSRENSIIVAGQDSEFIKAEDADKLIYGSDGEVKFKIFIR